MDRPGEIVARSVVAPPGADSIYVFLRHPEHVSVFKIHKREVVEATRHDRTGDQLLAEREATYTITDGRCSCEGFHFRAECRHSLHIEELGWT